MKLADQNNVLSGFDLTESLMWEIFSDLDPHKKGYLTEQDWINNFGNFEDEAKMIHEIKENLKENF